MKRSLVVLAAAFILSFLGSTQAFGQGAAQGPAQGGIKARGLFMEVGLGGQLTAYNGLTGQGQQVGGSFLVGYKLNRLILGLGLEYYHMATYQSQTGGGITLKEHEIINAMIFQPTVQFHLLESSPLALYLSGGIHVGFAVYDETDTDSDEDTGTTILGFHLGLGMRYFFHPRFCASVEAGFRGLWVLINYDPDGPGEQDTTSAVGAFYGRIGFAAIW
ncbi:MAG: outer membrane beta-barrel protein [Polyangia bacterium]|jgi:hypothetical protein|nr:outer membrane beta-barrel protein [Polyangia bacterium]